MSAPIPLVAKIEIGVLQNGKVLCNYNGPGRNMFNMMMETAKQDMLVIFQEKEKEAAQAPGIEIARSMADLPIVTGDHKGG
jgi:hypothetical protein